jgi:hypothetical protein
MSPNRRTPHVLLLVGAAAACSRKEGAPASDRQTPVLVVDERHNMGSGGDSAEPYAIPESRSLVLDASSYSVVFPKGFPAKTISAVHVVVQGSGDHRAAWDGHGRLNLSEANLTGNERFPGFRAGKQYVIAFGADSDDRHDFNVVWAALVDVARGR